MAKILFHYRLTPYLSTGCFPAEFLMGWRLRLLLDAAIPRARGQVCQSQQRQKLHHDLQSKLRQFDVEDSVFVKNFSPTHPHPAWLPSCIMSIRGPLFYDVCLFDNRIICHHIDHIHPQSSTCEPMPITSTLPTTFTMTYP